MYKWLKETGKTPRLLAKEDLRVEDARLKQEAAVQGRQTGVGCSVQAGAEFLRGCAGRRNGIAFDCMEMFYNRTRRHSHLGQMSLIDFEQAARTQT